MPTAAELDRLRVLTERLGPLASAAPGELILAEDWNLLVGVVGELARALLAQDRDAPPAAHEHVDQVSLGWLEPSLRALIQRGPLSDPAAESRLAELGRRLERIGLRSENLGGELQQLRGSLDTVATRDLIREAQLTETQRAVESQTGAAADVQALRETLRAVETDVRAAVDIGKRLVVDGQPFDPAVLTARVGAVEELRERLRRPDGELLDAAALERRLTDLTNTLVTESELDDALSQHRGRLDPAELAGLEERLRATAQTEGQAAGLRAADELRGELTQALAGIDDTIGRGISDALPGLRETLGEDQRVALDSAVAGLREETQALIGERTAALSTELRAELEAGELRGRDFATATATDLSEAAAAGIRADLGSQIGRLDGETSRLADAQAELSRGLQTTSARIEQVAVQEAAAREEQIKVVREEQRASTTRLEGRMTEYETRGTFETEQRDILAARVDELQATQDQRAQIVAEEAVRSFDARVEQIVAARVTERLADVDAMIAQTVRAQSDQAQVAIAQNLRQEIATLSSRVTAIDARTRTQPQRPIR